MDKKLVVWFNKLCGSNVGSALTTSMGQLILSARHKQLKIIVDNLLHVRILQGLIAETFGLTRL